MMCPDLTDLRPMPVLKLELEDGAGWFMGGMARPEGFLVCGFLEEFQPKETLEPPEEERHLEGV